MNGLFATCEAWVTAGLMRNECCVVLEARMNNKKNNTSNNKNNNTSNKNNINYKLAFRIIIHLSGIMTIYVLEGIPEKRESAYVPSNTINPITSTFK